MNEMDQLQVNLEPRKGFHKFTTLFASNLEAIIERLAFIMLIAWNFSPIAAGILSNLSPKDEILRVLYQFYTLVSVWYALLLITGFSGCLIGLIHFVKSIQEAKANSITIRQYIKANVFPLFLFLMIYWSLLSFLTAPYPMVHIIGARFRRDGILSYIAYFGLFYCGYSLKSKRLVTWIIKLFTWGAVIQSILMLINIEIVNNLLCLTPYSANFMNANHFGYYCCMAVMSSLYLFEIEEKNYLKVISLLQFSVIVVALIVNNSMGPYLAVISALIASLVFAIWLNKKRLKYVVTGMIIFVLLSMMINLANGQLFFELRILGADFTDVLNGEVSDIAGSGRWILWKNSIDIITSLPIFGAGPAHYSDLSNYLYQSPMRPHNEILEYAATIGIPGLLFYLAAIYALVKEFLKKRKQISSLVIGLSCIVLAYFVSSLFGVTMYYTSPFFFMFLGLLGVMLKGDTSILPSK